MAFDIERLADILSAAEAVTTALQQLRDADDAIWDRVCSEPLADALLDACAELEDQLERD